MDVMLDLETLGTGPNAAIVAIGAVAFSPASMSLGESFYRGVDLETAVRGGGEMDARTLLWWMDQSDEARHAIITGGTPLTEALEAFAFWLRDLGFDVNVWGNGAGFDNVILAQAYRRANMPVPWTHLRDRCYRTLKGLFPEVKMDRCGTHHNALDDARSQANHLLRILQRIQSPDRGWCATG